MDDKIRGAAMTRMFNLRNILKLVNDGLDDGPFAQQQLIRQMHELVFHVFAQSRDEVESLFKEQSCEGSRDIAAIPKQLASQMFDHLERADGHQHYRESDNRRADRLGH